MYFPKPHVLTGYEWLRVDVERIRKQSLESGRKIKHIRIQKGMYNRLRKNFIKYSPFGHELNSQITIHGIPIVAHDFEYSMMVEPIWNWKTLQRIY